ncbi:hypothetical protein C8R43DRAFT_1106958, partial [Mycena crocata]
MKRFTCEVLIHLPEPRDQGGCGKREIRKKRPRGLGNRAENTERKAENPAQDKNRSTLQPQSRPDFLPPKTTAQAKNFNQNDGFSSPPLSKWARSGPPRLNATRFGTRLLVSTFMSIFQTRPTTDPASAKFIYNILTHLLYPTGASFPLSDTLELNICRTRVISIINFHGIRRSASAASNPTEAVREATNSKWVQIHFRAVGPTRVHKTLDGSVGGD